MSDPKKVELASPEWYELATKILAEVARECGEDGFRLSVCEVFIDAPKEFADEDGTMSWCFYIDGKDVRCEKGNSKDVDLYMQGSWGPRRRTANLHPGLSRRAGEEPDSARGP